MARADDAQRSPSPTGWPHEASGAGGQGTAPGEPGAVTGGPSRAVRLAAQWLQQGRRVDMRGLGEALGVARMTLFRQTGGRDALLGDALWLLTERGLNASLARWEAERPPGALLSIGTGRLMNESVSKARGLRRLLDEEPALAMRVLTDPAGRVQPGVVAFVEALLRRDMDELGYVPVVEPGELAYALVRLGESFLYADVLGARQPDVATANRVQRALVEGARP